MPKRYAYNTSATQVKKRYAMIGSTATQVKKRYAMIGSTATLVYQAQSDQKTITVTAKDYREVTSSSVTNSENYTKMVIDSATVSGGNYGTNWARLYCNGSKVLDTGTQGTPAAIATKIQSWAGQSFNISQGGTVYIYMKTDINVNIDSYLDAMTITLKFHFE